MSDGLCKEGDCGDIDVSGGARFDDTSTVFDELIIMVRSCVVVEVVVDDVAADVNVEVDDIESCLAYRFGSVVI